MQPATVLLAGVPTSSTDVREKKASISRTLNWGENVAQRDSVKCL